MVAYRVHALTAVAVLALTSAAAAADLLPPPPAMEPPPPLPYAAESSGWYLRGDVGVGVNNTQGFATSPDSLAGAQASGFLSPNSNENYYNTSLSESALADFGVGYQFNNWFHADITGELRGGASFQGLEVVNDGGDATHNPQQYADFYRANLASYLGMVNGYVDLGNYGGFTPFVGGGLGVAYNNVYGITDNGTAGQNANSPISAVGGYLGNKGQLNFAWALMAGVDMTITRNLKLELGYRYLDYGKFKSGGSNCLAGPNAGGASFNCQNYTLASRELTASDFRIGLRYYFDTPAPAPEPAPLVRKY